MPWPLREVARAESTAPATAPAPAPVSVAEVVRAIRKRKRVIREAQGDDAPIAQVFTCAGCSENLHPHESIHGKYVCERVSRKRVEQTLATGAVVITREDVAALPCRCRIATTLADECNCERVAPTVMGIDLTLPDSVSATRMAERITRDEARAERVIADPSGRITRETSIRGFGAVVLCTLPCAAQRKQSRKPRGQHPPTDERVEYLALAHKHERGADGTFAVSIRTTAALGDLTGGRMDGETHYVRPWEAEQAYTGGVAWLKTLATTDAVRAQKANRKGTNIAHPVARTVALAVQRNEYVGDVGLALARALERM